MSSYYLLRYSPVKAELEVLKHSNGYAQAVELAETSCLEQIQPVFIAEIVGEVLSETTTRVIHRGSRS